MTLRGDILDRAKALTEGDRNKSYGSPKENMTLFGDLVTPYLQAVGFPVSATDAAVILCLLKISRITANYEHADNYLDLAAYAAIAGECAGVKLP